MEFLHWVTLYHGVINNLFGRDRQDAIKAMQDDADFDRWIVQYETKRASEDRGESNPSTPTGRSPGPRGKVAMSKEAYIKKFKAEV